MFEIPDVEKRFVTFMRERMMIGVATLVSLVVVTPLAYAQASYDRQVREGWRQDGGERSPPSRNPHEAQRPYGKRSEGGDGQREQRLSPEERRQLRRDIKDAGREVYLPRR